MVALWLIYILSSASKVLHTHTPHEETNGICVPSVIYTHQEIQQNSKVAPGILKNGEEEKKSDAQTEVKQQQHLKHPHFTSVYLSFAFSHKIITYSNEMMIQPGQVIKESIGRNKELPDQQMPSKKRQRLEKYIQNKLRKEERILLLKKLS